MALSKATHLWVAGGGGGASSSADERPAIRIRTDLHLTVDAFVSALARAPDLYQRDGELVRVLRAEETDERRGIVPGAPLIRPLELATLRDLASRVARWERWDGRNQEWNATRPDTHAVQAVHARGSWPTVRPLSGFTETPVMRPDGSILSAEGYDPATGLVLCPSCAFLPVADQPTQADAMNALRTLLEPLSDFPFATDAGRYVAPAAILTMLARPAIPGAVPAFVMDASVRGSGKTKLLDYVALVATGRHAPRLTYPKQEEELEKILSACALIGARLIALDNIASQFGAAALDKVLTAEDRVALRILGRSEMREVEWRAVLMGSGNNMSLGADTARRCLVARLEPQVERPEERTAFRFPDLLGHVTAHRAELVQAALTILRAYVVAGRPGAAECVWGSFGPWAELVAGAIRYAGGPNVLDARAVSAGADEPEVDALRAILSGLPRLCPTGATARTIVATLYPPDRRASQPQPPDGFDDLREALEALTAPKPGQAPEPRRLSYALRRFKGRIVAGRKLDSFDSHGGMQRWVVVMVGMPSSESVDPNHNDSNDYAN